VLGLEEPVVPGNIAAALAQAQAGFAGAAVDGEPELVVLLGQGERPDAWCWRVRVRDPQRELGSARTLYLETRLGQVIHSRSDVFNEDVTTGTVTSLGMPLVSDGCALCPYRDDPSRLVAHPIPGLRVTGTVGSNSAHTFTGQNGGYVLELGTTSQSISLDAWTAVEGAWYLVYDLWSGWLRSIVSTTVGSHANHALTHSTMSTERKVAQADAIVGINRAREFFKQYISTSVPGLSIPVWIYPNLELYCNAQAQILNSPPRWGVGFGLSLDDPNEPYGGCWNFASHGVAAHEFGHVALFMLDEAFLDFPSFHEGYADTTSNMIYNDSVQGRSHWRDGTNVREDPRSTQINCQYPIASNTTTECYCSASGHAAGQLLSGIWLRIRDEYVRAFGAEDGLEYTRQLFGEWSLLTLGGEPETCNPAYAETAVEVLESRHADTIVTYNAVCDAFAAHGISCP
jgi:hypothetical protein